MVDDIEKTCKRIEKEFYSNKPLKKKAFLSAIKSLSLFFKLYENSIPNASIRAKIIRLCYIYFREIDDLIDGDKSLTNCNVSFDDDKKIIFEYMYQRRNYLEDGCISSNPNELDEIIKAIIELSNKLELDLKSDSLKLLDCMLFDLNRRCDLKNGEMTLSAGDLIDKYYFQYYYESCLKMVVLLTTPKPHDIERKNINELGYAQRIYFNLEDFFEDLSYGIINIPSEDILNLGICEQGLINIARLPQDIINLCKTKGFNHPEVSQYIEEPILYWLNQQLDLGVQYLKSYQESAPLRSIESIGNELLFNRQDFSDIILRVGIERGTNKYLSKLLRHR